MPRSNANHAHRLRAMARGAVSPDFGAGLNAAADMLDGKAGPHMCLLPATGHYYECQTCRVKWYGFHPVAVDGSTKVEWVTAARKAAAS